MCEVTRENFTQLYSGIETAIKNAKFITIDTEFQSSPTKSCQSLFDSTETRYRRQRNNINYMIPVQIGLTAFSFDRDRYCYVGSAYTFYIFPTSFANIDCTFHCEAKCLKFLSENSFDFNKWVYNGIPFLTRDQEIDLRKVLGDGNFILNYLFVSLNTHEEKTINNIAAEISSWFIESKKDDNVFSVKNDLIKKSTELNYYLHKFIRQKYNNKIWSYEKDGEFVVQIVTPEQFEELSKADKLDEEVVQHLLGFSKIFRLITESKVPLVGHNLLTDLMLIVNSFERSLPYSYTDFKKTVNELFPIIYDTKCISFDIRSKLPEENKRSLLSLESMYDYFNNKSGRHLALNAPMVEVDRTISQDTSMSYGFHNAGWDSYCTGVCFIRMAHFYTSQKYTKGCVREFTSHELFCSMGQWKNLVNMTRARISHLKLDGADPVSTRPPLLLVQAAKNTAISLSEVVDLLKPLGYIEVKPYNILTSKNNYLVAVDNYSSMTHILEKYNRKSNAAFYVTKYSKVHHSHAFRAFLWGSLVMCSSLLAYVTHTGLFKR